jgi:hypothetical protein
VASGLFAQTSWPDKVQPTFIQQDFEIDGLLNDTVWNDAIHISNFTQRELNMGEPVTERTEVAVLYSGQFLYFGVWCYDSDPEKITAKELRRDFNYGIDDNFIIIIDTYLDKRNGFMFVTNPNAARADLQVFNNGGSVNEFWDGVWNVKTTRTDKGWFAEFKIPLYTLKYRTGMDVQDWGINFERNIRRKREQARWQGWNRNYAITDVSRAGTLSQLSQLRDERFIEVKPYALGGVARENKETEGTFDGGGDTNYLISPTYRLNLTFNTDFAQVEADRQQVNLTRFPLFFPELREFFLEGSDFFDFGFGGNRITPFYSRRIGLDTNRRAVPIIAGARLLGKEQNSTVGLMSLQTADDGFDRTTNYTIGSWRQDVGKQSVIGAMSANKIEDGRWHTTTGINGRYSTAQFIGNRNLNLGGAFIQTYDTDTAFDEMAWAYRLFANYPNDKLNIFASTQRSPAPFDPEIGLVRRSNFRENFIAVNLRPRPKGSFKWIRQFDFTPANITYVQYDDNGQLQTFEYNLGFLGFNTRSGETINLDYRVRSEGLRRDFEIFPGIVLPARDYWWRNWRGSFSTFRGRDLAFNTTITAGEYYNGSTFQGSGQVFWRASKHLNVNAQYEKNIVELKQGNFETDLISARLAYAINPNLFGSVLSQWNSAAEVFNFNFRLQLIPKIGTDFFLIVNQVYDTTTGEFIPERGTILGKLIWRFVL